MIREALISKLSDQQAGRNAKRIREILVLRGILEPEIAALAAANAGPRDMARLDAVLAGQAAAAPGESDLGDIDLRFHLDLAHIAKNEVILETMSVLYDMLRECRVAPLQGPERQRLSLEGHRGIRDAIAAGDAAAARLAMRRHLETIGEVAVGG